MTDKLFNNKFKIEEETTVEVNCSSLHDSWEDTYDRNAYFTEKAKAHILKELGLETKQLNKKRRKRRRKNYKLQYKCRYKF